MLTKHIRGPQGPKGDTGDKGEPGEYSEGDGISIADGVIGLTESVKAQLEKAGNSQEKLTFSGRGFFGKISSMAALGWVLISETFENFMSAAGSTEGWEWNATEKRLVIKNSISSTPNSLSIGGKTIVFSTTNRGNVNTLTLEFAGASSNPVLSIPAVSGTVLTGDSSLSTVLRQHDSKWRLVVPETVTDNFKRYLEFEPQSSSYRLRYTDSGLLIQNTTNAYYGTFSLPQPSGYRSWILPDVSGTVLLKEQLEEGAGISIVGGTLISLTADVQETLAHARMPSGVILEYGGIDPPSGYAACDFAELERTGAYANLFATIGTRYGAGDGSTTFNLPDKEGYIIKL